MLTSGPKTDAGKSGEWRLVRAAVTGDRDARARLLRTIADTVWTACTLCEPAEPGAKEAFTEVMAAIAADDYQKLRAFDGRHPLASYVAILSRDLLATRAVNLLVLDRERGWKAIEHFFRSDIQRILRQKLPAPLRQSAAEDAYQTIALALAEDDFRRLRAYQGKGSFSGYVLHMVERLAVDFVRSQVSRRRPPAAVQQLGQIEQIAFRMIYWEGEDERAPAFADGVVARYGAPASAEDVAEALGRLRRALPPGFDGRASDAVRLLPVADIEDTVATADDAGPTTPESELLQREDEELLSDAIAALRTASLNFSAEEKVFLRHLLAGLPPRNIAKLMDLAVPEVNRLRRKVIRNLFSDLNQNLAVKNWLVSVYLSEGRMDIADRTVK